MALNLKNRHKPAHGESGIHTLLSLITINYMIPKKNLNVMRVISPEYKFILNLMSLGYLSIDFAALSSIEVVFKKHGPQREMIYIKVR